MSSGQSNESIGMKAEAKNDETSSGVSISGTMNKKRKYKSTRRYIRYHSLSSWQTDIPEHLLVKIFEALFSSDPEGKDYVSIKDK